MEHNNLAGRLKLKSKILIEIFGIRDNNAGFGWGKCSSGSLPTIWQKYGSFIKYINSGSLKDKVEIRFIDAARDNIRNYPQALGLLRKKYPLPLVFINGIPKFYGGFPYEAICNEIEKYL